MKEKQKRVITYGTYDCLHQGHINLLNNAKALGDYLIVGVTSDNFDRARGKINNQQTLVERLHAVEALGIADEVIVEEYEGQKIEDIKRYNVDIFTVGSDWEGRFDYLKAYCDVVYLPRTKGVSSTDIRSEKRQLKIRLLGGESTVGEKFERECGYVNGVDCVTEGEDAYYIVSHPSEHYKQAMEALESGKHVICESPIATKKAKCEELFKLAKEKGLVLMDGIKTAYSTAYERLLGIARSGSIGEIVSVDVTCTSMADELNVNNLSSKWNSITAWGPTALLPVFQLLGCAYKDVQIVSHFLDKAKTFDGFTKINFVYDHAVATVKVAKSAKSEGELVITGTKGYIYVPAPWWKTDYFELRFENPLDTKRYFYQLDGEGIRYEILAFAKAVNEAEGGDVIPKSISLAIAEIVEKCASNDVVEI